MAEETFGQSNGGVRRPAPSAQCEGEMHPMLPSPSGEEGNQRLGTFTLTH